MLQRNVWVAACALLLAACGGGGGELRGQVQFEGGGDASGVTVRLAGGEREQLAVTGADGAWGFDDVGDGAYALAFEASDTVEGRKGLAVVVKDGKAGEVPAVTFTAASTVTGKVTAGADTGNLGIQVAVAGTQLVAVTADDGSFRLAGVPSGQRVLVATRGGYIAQSTVSVTRGAFEAPAFALGKQAVRPGQLEGSVRYWDMRPSTDITLSVAGLVDGVHPAADGTFRIALPEGTWELVANAPGYPRQVVARAAVTPDAATNIGVKKLAAASRFATNDGAQYGAYSRLMEDGVHALVSREGWENVTHSMVDLRTGEERLFLTEWNWLTDSDDFTAARDGHYVAAGTSWGTYLPNGDYTQHSSFHVFDTTTGAHLTQRGQAATYPTNEELWGFSADGSAFFGLDTRELHRISLPGGEHVAARSDRSVFKGDAEHFLTFANGESDATVGTALFLTRTGGAQTVASGVQVDAAMLQSGTHAAFLSNCAGGTCALQVANLLTGAVTPVADGAFAQGSNLLQTDHADWVRVQGTRSAYVRLSTATATTWPAEFTSGMADAARISKDGSRIAFTRLTDTTHSLYLAAMPVTAIPGTALEAGTEAFTYAWLTGSRFVATTSTGNRVISQSNDTRGDVTAVAAGSAVVLDGDAGAVYRRASDGAFMAMVGDATVQLTDADPDGKLFFRRTPHPWTTEPAYGTTKDGAYTLWQTASTADGRITTVALKKGGTTPVRFRDFSFGQYELQQASRTGVMGWVSNWDGQDVVLDLESGVQRQIWETDVDDWDWGFHTEKGETDYLMLTYATGRSVQMYNSSSGAYPVYETGVLKY